ncbi:MAG: hypothetical protein KF725_09295 [Cyclobacteriaceae bacterium]|nr:hypothetical protein [Cyclobacteriaceae bacterium]UYN88144.1 MAG: hypothetical protein KIT51_07835 [Cyclobacteriaceae bacterium]
MKGFLLIAVAIVLVILAIVSVDAGLYTGYALFAIALLSAIVLPLVNVLKSPGDLKKALFAIVGMVVLFGISYALAGSEVSADHAAKGITPNVSKLVGAGLIMFYLTSAIAVLGLIYSEINKAIK